MIIRSCHALRVVIVALVLSGLGIAGTTTAAGASLNCGQYSFGFVGTRLLNDGISTSAGPFTIDLPAGTYDVMMSSYDAHDEHPGQIDQPYEQWYFTLDSGFTSPLSTDVPDDSTTTVDTFEDVVIDAATSITLHHRGLGSVNSVEPLCAGFTSVTEELPRESQDPQDPEGLTPEVESSNTPDSASSATDLVRPAEEVPRVEVEPATEVRVTELVPTPAAIVTTPVTGTAPQLALTGPTSQIWLAALTGASLILLGVALLIQGRREIA